MGRWRWLLASYRFLGILTATSALGEGVDLEQFQAQARANQVSRVLIQKLRFDFSEAKSPTALDLSVAKWSCDVYGLKSQKRVTRDLKLYHFDSAASFFADDLKAAPGSYVNRGATGIAHYQRTPEGLKGEKKQLTDMVRILKKDGRTRLLAELSLPRSLLPFEEVNFLPSLVKSMEDRWVVTLSECVPVQSLVADARSSLSRLPR